MIFVNLLVQGKSFRASHLMTAGIFVLITTAIQDKPVSGGPLPNIARKQLNSD